MEVAERVAIARGGVLDGLAALQGLVDVLRSRRVGAKVVSRALPEVADGLAATDSAVADLFAVIAPPFAAGASVVRRTKSIVAELRAELLDPAPLDARRRITLEARLLGTRRELEAALLVGELAARCSSPQPIAVDVADVLRHRWSGGVRAGDPALRLAIDLGEVESFPCDPRILVALLEIAASSVVASGVALPRLTAAAADKRFLLRVDGDAAENAPEMTVRAYLLSADMTALASQAALRAGVTLVLDADGAGRIATVAL